MGDRFFLQLDCAYCKELNDDVYFAESSGVTTFTCEHCKKKNKIDYGFVASKQ